MGSYRKYTYTVADIAFEARKTEGAVRKDIQRKKFDPASILSTADYIRKSTDAHKKSCPPSARRSGGSARKPEPQQEELLIA
jgi:hypothetical protein